MVTKKSSIKLRHVNLICELRFDG